MNGDDVRRLVTFILFTFALSWGGFLGVTALTPNAGGFATYALFMFGPLVGGYITATIYDERRKADVMALRLRFNLWWFVAWLAPLAIVGLAWGLSLLVPGVDARPFAEGSVALAKQGGLPLEPDAVAALPPLWLALLLAATLGGTINILFAIGEEAGWRGYFWTVLRPLGFWRASAITGFVWGLWHAPLIASGHNYGTEYPGSPWLGIGMMIVFTMALSPLLGLLRDRTGTSWAPALFHGTLNAVGPLVAVVLVGGSPLVTGVAGLCGIAGIGIVTAIFVSRRSLLAAPPH